MIMLLTPWMAGCSAIRLGYANGPQLAWWWLDGYVDFSSEQTPAAKQAIDRWFDWHRNTQLTDYAALLASTQAPILQPTTGAQACRWQDLIREQLEPAFERAIVEFAELLSPCRLRMRVWERGTGITLACGSGACATAVAAHLRGMIGPRVAIEVDGGVLEVDWRDDGVWLTGPVARVFDGVLSPDYVAAHR